jgi:hypothetical protein
MAIKYGVDAIILTDGTANFFKGTISRPPSIPPNFGVEEELPVHVGRD